MLIYPALALTLAGVLLLLLHAWRHDYPDRPALRALCDEIARRYREATYDG